MDAKKFIINLAVEAFNRQFKQKHNPKDFDCFSIKQESRDRCMFEVFTKRNFDYLRIRLLVGFEKTTRIDKYRLVLSVPTIIRGLGDEVWYANGFIAYNYLGNGATRAPACPIIVANKNITLIAENTDGILTEEGEEILVSE